jgi:polyhydroxyalkanoate synthase
MLTLSGELARRGLEATAAWVDAWTHTPPGEPRLAALIRSVEAEMKKDLAALPDDFHSPDLSPLTAAALAVAAGTATPLQKTMVERFRDAALVKLRLGAEHYADPDRVSLGVTARHEVARFGAVQLFRYGERGGPPVLVVYSLINRASILDLIEGDSFVAHMSSRGLDVYLIEWNGETEAAAGTTWDDLVAAIESCRAFVEAATGMSPSLFGHCIGGTLAATHAARFPGRSPALFLLTAPFAPPREGVTAAWSDRALFDVDSLLAAHGRMPGKAVRYTFLTAKPYFEALRWRMFIDGLADDTAHARFLAIDKWANDNVDIPAEAFRVFAHAVVQSTALRDGEVAVLGERVDLRSITSAVAVCWAQADWIVPPDAATAVFDVLPPSVERIELPGGHLGFVLDPRCRPRWDEVVRFLSAGR